MKTTVCIFALFLVALTFAKEFPCDWTATGSDGVPFKAHYNLLPLMSTSEWTVKDTVITSGRNFTYVFNICSTVKTVPRPTGSGTSCRTKYVDEEGKPKTLSAYQVANNADACYALSDGSEGKWKLLDTTDPTYGIGYIYDNGDATGCPMGRTLEIDLYCQDNAYNVPTYNRVDEVSGCYYVMDMQSIYGCPTECGIASHRLCGGNGVCKLDKDAQAPQCYCYSGFWGTACANEGEQTPEGFTTTTWALVVVFVFLLLAELVIVCMWNKISSLRLDPNAYKSMMLTDDIPV